METMINRRKKKDAGGVSGKNSATNSLRETSAEGRNASQPLPLLLHLHLNI
jgi:hypothetical protein